MDENKLKQSRPKNNSWTKLHFGSVNSVLCTECNNMREKKNLIKKKKKQRDSLQKSTYVRTVLQLKKKKKNYVSTFLSLFFQAINLCKKRKFTQFKKSTSAVIKY